MKEKDTNFTKNIDAVGKIMIPKEIRDMFDIQAGDSFEFYVNDNSGFFHKQKQDCIILKKK